MAALINQTQVGLKSYGNAVIVQNDPKAKLMYYFDCICRILEMENTGEIRRLRDFGNFFSLTEDEIDKLLIFCVMLSPDDLHGKCIFQNDEMCGDYDNELYELSSVSRTLAVSDSVLVGGERRRVRKIMTFKMCWLQTYYVQPMQHFRGKLERIAEAVERASRPRRTESFCSIM